MQNCEKCSTIEATLARIEAELHAIEGQRELFGYVACLLIQRNQLRRELARHHESGLAMAAGQ